MKPPAVTTAEAVRTLTDEWKKQGKTWALVPTMGALHAGHAALVEEASAHYDAVVLSIFVNPLQFGQGEDFDRYPRSLDDDLAFLENRGVAVVFAPDVSEIYPGGIDAHQRLDAGPIGDLFEGASRPGHFDGVVTVVRRLCDIVQPQGLVMGKKDAQQLFLVSAMIRAERLPIEMHEVETVREDDGLALSSRNRYLSSRERDAAEAIPRALRLATQAPNLSQALASARAVLDEERGLRVDYLEVVDADTFLPLPSEGSDHAGLMIVAAWAGETRLIDNQRLSLAQ